MGRRLRELEHLPGIAFTLAVGRKRSEDDGGHLAAVIAYYGFFSLFPLLLVLTTALGYVLAGHPGAQRSIEGTALADFPVIGPQLKVHGLHGNAFALAAGLVGALWAGLAVVLALESALNRIWGVERDEQPSFLWSRLRALLILTAAGTAVIGASLLSGAASFASLHGPADKAAALAGSFVIDLALVLVVFRVAIAGSTWRQVFVGALCAACALTVLQSVGGSMSTT
jgi:uncharacterized BrkB/YihY/UPF0761 family membrane protein